LQIWIWRDDWPPENDGPTLTNKQRVDENTGFAAPRLSFLCAASNLGDGAPITLQYGFVQHIKGRPMQPILSRLSDEHRSEKIESPSFIETWFSNTASGAKAP